MIIFALLLIIFIWPKNIHAFYNPLMYANDIDKAASFVNANGDWGYVTFVIQENDRSVDKWQNIFNQLRRLHLIPIVRLATYPLDNVWAIPEKEK